jgi:hypothetical protein
LNEQLGLGAFEEERVTQRADGFQIVGVLQAEQLAVLTGIAYTPPATESRTAASEPTSASWRSPYSTYNVNDDGVIAALDALSIINELNRRVDSAVPLPEPNQGEQPPPYYEMSGDNLLTARDPLLVLNFLKRADSQPKFEIAAQTEPITSFSASGDLRIVPSNNGMKVTVNVERFHTVFVTRDNFIFPEGPQYAGTTRNIRLIDLKCNGRADPGSLISNWDGSTLHYKAIISDDSEDARTRIAIQGKVKDTAGNLIANDDADMWDRSLQKAIDRDECRVEVLTQFRTVFASSTTQGQTIFNGNCSNYTLRTSGEKSVGQLNRSDVNWIERINFDCDSQHHIYWLLGLKE